MLHPSPVLRRAGSPAEGADGGARLASIRQALRAADMIAGKSATELSAPFEISEIPAQQRSSAGESLLAPGAAKRLRDELSSALAHVEPLLARR